MNNWKWPGPALLFPYPPGDDASTTPLERALLQWFDAEYTAQRRIKRRQLPARKAGAWKRQTFTRLRNHVGLSGELVPLPFGPTA